MLRSRQLTVLLAVCQFLLACLGTVPARAVGKPNIVVILTDDQTAALANRMPNLKRLVAARGATFTHAYYNDPLCSPSRATFLTGLYTQNTHVDDNTPRKKPGSRGCWLEGRELDGVAEVGEAAHEPPGLDLP